MIKKRSRKELYEKFRQGAIPSGADFADFIRSQVNLIDDGLDIPDDPADPINFRARGEDENLMDFSDPDNNKRWRISGRSEDLSREGINIKADDRSHLFIERDSGSIGIDTDQPEAKLHIKQVSSPDAIRIDDEGNDSTPFVITSEGKVGVGIGKGSDRPSALLHINNPNAGDTLRIGNNQEGQSHLVINKDGYIGMGYDQPSQHAKLAIDGAVTIGKRDIDPGTNGLYVMGDVRIDGNITFTEGDNKGSIELTRLLKSSGEDVVIKDNVRIIGDPTQDESLGNLYVEGDSTLGTYKGKTINNNEVIVNGSIVSGYHPDNQSDFQEELVINEALKVNRKTKVVTLEKDLKATSGTINAIDTLNVHNGLSFSISTPDVSVNKIVKEVSNSDHEAIPTEGAILNYVQNTIIPVGSIIIWAHDDLPDGWLECDGSLLDKKDYLTLHDIIGDIYGENSDLSKFRIPDYRGYFLRGISRKLNRDPEKNIRDPRGDGIKGNNVGTRQSDQIRRHYHNFIEAIRSDRGGPNEGMDNDSEGHFNSRTDYAGGKETRPVNINVIFLIKWK